MRFRAQGGLTSFARNSRNMRKVGDEYESTIG